MVNLNGHEVGNDGHSQEKPVATTPEFYSTNCHRNTRKKHRKKIRWNSV